MYFHCLKIVAMLTSMLIITHTKYILIQNTEMPLRPIAVYNVTILAAVFYQLSLSNCTGYHTNSGSQSILAEVFVVLL